MGWFDDQIRERKEYDELFLEVAFNRAANVIRGKKNHEVSNSHLISIYAILDILDYYHYKMVHIPDNLETIEERLDYCLRHYGIMRREIQLEKGWHRDAFGPILAFRKEDDMPVALLPRKSGGYCYSRDDRGKKIKVTNVNENLYKERAVCFYRPLPMRKLGILDLLRYMWSFVNLKDLLNILVLAFFIAFIGIINPKITKVLTGNLLIEAKYSVLLGIAVFLVCMSFTSWLLESIKNLLAVNIKSKIVVSIQSAMMMRLMALPATFFKKYSVGELKSRQKAIGDLCELILDILFGIGLSSLFSLLYLTQIFRINYAVMSVSLYTLILTIVVFFVAAFFQSRVSRVGMKKKAQESGVSLSLISGIKKLKLTGAENRAFAKWLIRYSEWADIKFNPPWVIKIEPVVVTAISLIATILLYLVSVITAMSQSSYYAFTVAYGSLMGSFMMLSEAAVSIGQIRPAFELAKPFLRTAPEAQMDKEVITRLSGKIEMDHVYFRYNEDSRYILEDVSLKIKPGEYLAVVGETGCGKSTLMRLLLGLEVTDRGFIYYDGKEMRNIDPSSLRKKIGTVMQQGGLFQGDIYSNITISAPELTIDDAWEAAEIAGIAEDIRNMPMGMHTLITEGSGSVSGGQKQRLMIARAVAPKPRILFLDEATSALDNVTQKHVAESLDAMGCTRIVIAHRLSTIRHCDRIVLLKDGRIAEDGTYEELIAKNGFFAELVERQRLDSED